MRFQISFLAGLRDECLEYGQVNGIGFGFGQNPEQRTLDVAVMQVPER